MVVVVVVLMVAVDGEWVNAPMLRTFLAASCSASSMRRSASSASALAAVFRRRVLGSGPGWVSQREDGGEI